MPWLVGSSPPSTVRSELRRNGGEPHVEKRNVLRFTTETRLGQLGLDVIPDKEALFHHDWGISSTQAPMNRKKVQLIIQVTE